MWAGRSGYEARESKEWDCASMFACMHINFVSECVCVCERERERKTVQISNHTTLYTSWNNLLKLSSGNLCLTISRIKLGKNEAGMSDCVHVCACICMCVCVCMWEREWLRMGKDKPKSNSWACTCKFSAWGRGVAGKALHRHLICRKLLQTDTPISSHKPSPPVASNLLHPTTQRHWPPTLL